MQIHALAVIFIGLRGINETLIDQEGSAEHAWIAVLFVFMQPYVRVPPPQCH